MKIIGEVKKIDIVNRLALACETSSERTSDTEKKYRCVLCDNIFYSENEIFYNLCGRDFMIYKSWLFREQDKLLKNGESPYIGFNDFMASVYDRIAEDVKKEIKKEKKMMEEE